MTHELRMPCSLWVTQQGEGVMIEEFVLCQSAEGQLHKACKRCVLVWCHCVRERLVVRWGRAFFILLIVLLGAHNGASAQAVPPSADPGRVPQRFEDAPLA